MPDWTYDDVPVPAFMYRGYTGHEHLDAFGVTNSSSFYPWKRRANTVIETRQASIEISRQIRKLGDADTVV